MGNPYLPWDVSWGWKYKNGIETDERHVQPKANQPTQKERVRDYKRCVGGYRISNVVFGGFTVGWVGVGL